MQFDKGFRRGFSTVEILVAVGLVAILMVVAVPRLLGTRQSVGDSAAKQQLRTVSVAVSNWYADRDTHAGLTETALQNRVPEIDIVATGTATGKPEGGRALTVGMNITTGSSPVVTLAASNGDNNCWAIRHTANGGVEYGYARIGTGGVASCTATAMASRTFVGFEFPPAAE